MAYSTVPKSTDYFNTKLWTGNSTNSTAITGVGFQPDMVWIKNRSTTDNHAIFDAIRGATYRIYPNNTDAQIQATNSLASFDSDGFTLNDGGDANGNGENIVGWNWKANGAGSANTDGSINTTATSANTTSGFSMSTASMNASGTWTIGHGLGVAPKVVLVKVTGATSDWWMWHESLGGGGKYIKLNINGSSGNDSTVWNNAVPTSSLFSMGSNTWSQNTTFIAYCFADVQGFSKMGSYIGNGNADGAFVYTGFKPAWVLIKNTQANETWMLFDNKRLGYNVANSKLNPDEAAVEGSGTFLDLLSNGFKIRTSASTLNTNAQSFIYMAFAEAPLVGSNNVPANAR